jgi:sugar phosphate isomerase/epimerase
MLRRTFLRTSSLALTGTGKFPFAPGPVSSGDHSLGCTLALNAYSFNKALLEEGMSLDELFRFARITGFSGVDLTAYYIPGYPEVPEDSILFGIRKKVFQLGLALSGTGVRNDFTLSDPSELEKQVQLVKEWVLAAVKIGAPHVRVFAGSGSGTGESRSVVKSRIIGSMKECADYAGSHGIMIAFQNHRDYIRSTDEILEILDAVGSEWFGLMLDIGSVEGPDPYSEIRKLIPYAASWQVKEEVQTDKGSTPVDFEKLMKLVRESGYHGFFPLETLGEGDPHQKVTALYNNVTRWIS